eukprot:TRINITY_DN83099_c0_g1_i1.p1 TRINITY_DN83099_c0_g1~~TRINITY_DN83099_c0_g1_i1.p1  ORF type:complete len:308 (-),score=26.65 TRINITY_DN83099_c0_g1_i1:106-921(-)
MIYFNCPVHLDALTGKIDFRNIVVRFPPQVPKQFSWTARFYVYLLVLSAVINAMVWISVTMLAACIWNLDVAWNVSTHSLAKWLVLFEGMLLARGAVRKAISVLLDIASPADAVPLMPPGTIFDLVIWNGSQLILAVKLFQLQYDTDALAGIMEVSLLQAQATVFVVRMMGWTSVLGCIIRLLWPCVDVVLRSDFQREAALTLVETFPTIDLVAQCSICLEESHGLCMLPCNHGFHRHCLRTWFQNNPDSASCNPCAVCRREATQLMAGSE